MIFTPEKWETAALHVEGDEKNEQIYNHVPYKNSPCQGQVAYRMVGPSDHKGGRKTEGGEIFLSASDVVAAVTTYTRTRVQRCRCERACCPAGCAKVQRARLSGRLHRRFCVSAPTMFAQQQTHLRTHFSEYIPVVQWCITVHNKKRKCYLST